MKAKWISIKAISVVLCLLLCAGFAGCMQDGNKNGGNGSEVIDVRPTLKSTTINILLAVPPRPTTSQGMSGSSSPRPSFVAA